MMGSGKTAVARLLGTQLNRRVIDLDEKIVESQDMSINDIFASKGEPYFREVEHAELRKASFAEAAVVAAGGGIVINDENIEVMKATGVMVYLQSSIEALFSHLQADTERPLLKVADPKAKLSEIFEGRRLQYEKAHHIIESSALNPQQIADAVITTLNF